MASEAGRSARIISNIVARKAVSLLGEGVRDGAAARAVHDYLRTHRSGQVSAELQMVSVDLATRSLVISRNARCPSYVWADGTLQVLEDDSEPIGIRENTKPQHRRDASSGRELCHPVYGWPAAGAERDARRARAGVRSLLSRLLAGRPAAQSLADTLLEMARRGGVAPPARTISASW